MKYTDEQIIKALEEMVEYPQNYEEGQKLKSVLDLINRQKAEIEKLKKIEHFADKTIEKQSAEIDDLINKLECLLCHATGGRLSKHTYPLKVMETEVTDAMNGNYNQGYDDGIKEFAERLKKGKQYSVVPVAVIDWVAKEMVGDEE